MSTILKALRRLEQEKNTRSDRPLGEAVAGAVPVPAPRAAASRRWPIFAGIGIGVIVLGAAAFAAIQWSRGGGESAPVEVAAVPVEPEIPAVVGRRPAAPEPVQGNRAAANRRLRQARKLRAEASAPRELSPETAQPRVAAVARTEPKPESRLGTPQTPANAASARSPGWISAHRSLTSPVTPSQGESPVIDLSQLEALQAAAKSASESPESIASAAVVPTPRAPAPTPATAPAPAPVSKSQPAPVEVSVARPPPEPVSTPAASTAPKAEPTARSEPGPDAEPKPQPQRPRSVARKSPPRPSSVPQPKLYVSRTVWHPDASRRIAYVEFEGHDGTVALREGESIGPLLVTEIAPTAVSFDNRGSELTRRVGER